MGKVVDWVSFTPALVPAYKGRTETEKGESPYGPVMLLKMLFLAKLWGISERRVEELCCYYVPAKAFVGPGKLDRAPDHSILTVFKERLEKHLGAADYARVFDKIVQ
ncbi:MAG: transposase [Chloroflexota bacterium]|nr:transposase [Chloroflexota bacterium]